LHGKYKSKQAQLKDAERTGGEKSGKVEELMREAVAKVKEAELLKVELTEAKTLSDRLKTKLSEAQEALKSNENLIAYLNKQLNEKPGATPSLAPTTISSKPPLTFKPSFSSVEQLTKPAPLLSSTLGARSGSLTNFERMPSPSIQNSARSNRMQSPATTDKLEPKPLVAPTQFVSKYTKMLYE
jgi:hypothetical protein